MISIRYTPRGGATTTVSIAEDRDPFAVLDRIFRAGPLATPRLAVDPDYERAVRNHDEKAAVKIRQGAKREHVEEVVDRPAPARAEAGDLVAKGARETGGAQTARGAGGVRAASLDAYREIVASGRVTEQQGVILEYFVRNTGSTFTRQELAKGLSIGINAICGRVNELVDAGLLAEVGRRACRVTGNSVNALAVAGGLAR